VVTKSQTLFSRLAITGKPFLMPTNLELPCILIYNYGKTMLGIFPQTLLGQEKSLAELNGTFESHIDIFDIEAHDVLLNWENGSLKNISLV